MGPMHSTCDAVGEGLSSAHSALSAWTKRSGMLSAASSLHRWFSGKGPCSCSMCQVQAMAVCVRKPLSASLSSISAAKTGIPCSGSHRGVSKPSCDHSRKMQNHAWQVENGGLAMVLLCLINKASVSIGQERESFLNI